MAEMNPIIQTLIQLIQAKQNDEQLAQRKAEADAKNQFEMEQLARQGVLDRATIAHQLATQKLAEAQTKSDFEWKNYRPAAAEGLVELQGEDRLPAGVATYLRGSLVPGAVPYDLSTKEPFANRELTEGPEGSFIPYSDQIAMGPLGPQLIQGVVPREKVRKQRLEDFNLQMGLDILKAGLTESAKVKAREPEVKAKADTQKEIEAYKAARAAQLEEIKAAHQMRLQEKRSATTLQAANIRKSGTQNVDNEYVDSLYEDAKFGRADLIGSTNPVQRAKIKLRQNDEIALSKKSADNIADINNLYEIVRLAEEIEPLLGEGITGSLGNAIKSAKPGTPLYEKGGALMAKTPLLSNVFGVKGTQSDRDIANLLKGLWGAFTTGNKLRENIKALKSQAKVSFDIQTKGMSNFQKLETLKYFGFNPENFNEVVTLDGKVLKDKNGTPHTRFRIKDNEWSAFNPKTRNWEVVD